MDTDFGFLMQSCRYSVEWLTTYSNQVEYDWLLHSDDRDTASTSTTVFVPPASNNEIKNTDVKNVLASENLDKGKSILGAPPKLDKKDIKNPKAKKANSQKPKQKKQHLCHHCGAASHTRSNYYKWLATQ